MELSNTIPLTRICALCGNIRTYKTKNGWKRASTTPNCRSCINSILLGGTGNVRAKNGAKICAHCKENLAITEFAKYANGRLHSLCAKCKSADYKKRYYSGTTYRFKRYGITYAEYLKMYADQKGTCFLCGIAKPVLQIDHNHTTKQIRKLLCKPCNMSLGIVNENIQTLTNMVAYLEQYK